MFSFFLLAFVATTISNSNNTPFGVTVVKATQEDFYAEVRIDFDASIMGNSEVVGAHLHTGKASVNGPVNIILCGRYVQCIHMSE
jgi:hypothetical protein